MSLSSRWPSIVSTRGEGAGDGLGVADAVGVGVGVASCAAAMVTNKNGAISSRMSRLVVFICSDTRSRLNYLVARPLGIVPNGTLKREVFIADGEAKSMKLFDAKTSVLHERSSDSSAFCTAPAFTSK